VLQTGWPPEVSTPRPVSGYLGAARTSYAEDLLRDRQLERLFNIRLLAIDNLYLTLARGAQAASTRNRTPDSFLRATLPTARQ